MYTASSVDGTWQKRARINNCYHHAGRSSTRFSGSTEGIDLVSRGPALTLNNAWRIVMGYRYTMFDYATRALGGAVTVKRFEMTTP